MLEQRETNDNVEANKVKPEEAPNAGVLANSCSQTKDSLFGVNMS